MADLAIDLDLLRRFEQGLDPRFPERGEIPARVMGYGEISTVLEIGADAGRNLAYKRMPMFRTEQEAERYAALYRRAIQVLEERVGLRIVPGEVVRVVNERTGRIVIYIVQQRFPSETVGHKAIHHLPAAEVRRLALAVLRETAKVFDFNKQHRGELELGIDGQISNWAIVDFDPAAGRLPDEVKLIYFDTSSPFLTVDGKEQLDPELFLRSAPSFMVWILRLLFLEDVMTRYYDFRKVAIDIIANFFKEQRPDLVPGLVAAVNGFFTAEVEAGSFKPISVDEVRAYYREDAWIWRLYLNFRKIDRFLHRLLGKDYPYILPGRIKR